MSKDTKILLMDGFVELGIPDVTHISFIKEHGLLPYLHKITIYAAIALTEPSKKNLERLEKNFEFTAQIYMRPNLLDNENVDVQFEIKNAEIILLILTNFIGVMQGHLGLPPSKVVKKWTKKLDAFVKHMKESQKKPTENQREESSIPWGGYIAG